MVIIKSKKQVDIMQEGGQILAETHSILEKATVPGITTKELDSIAREHILSKNAKPSFKGYRGFQGNICTSVNNQVIHGLPGLNKLKSGDIVSVDIGVYYKGYHTDAARTYSVGKISSKAQQLIDVTKQSFFKGIECAVEGGRLFDISHAVQQHVESNGYSIVRDYVGHGVGEMLHEPPNIPNFGQAGKGIRLKAGMTLAVEPMVNMGKHHIKILSDGWTVVTADRSLSAHYENTVVVTKDRPLILTL